MPTFLPVIPWTDIVSTLPLLTRSPAQEWRKISALFHDYMIGQRDFIAANCGDGEKVGLLRTIPHEGVIDQQDYVEILDYQRASAIIEEQKTFAVGACSCRHTALHMGTKTCDVPLHTCSAFGIAAELLIPPRLCREGVKGGNEG